jgi:hypothetical protein
MPFIAQWPDANIRFDSITTVIKDKLVKISQAAIDRYLKKDRAACAIYGNPQRQKSHQTGRFPEIPYPYQNLLNALLSSFREFPSDNGSEFINHVVTDWYCNAACPSPFTRSTDHRKNDNCCATCCRVE